MAKPDQDSMEPISLEESKRLVELEKIVRAGQQTFFEVGLALGEIMARKLYRADYETFAEYCDKQWNWSARYAQFVMKAAETVYQLPNEMRTIVRTEGQARELARVPADKRAAVLARAGETPTAKSIKTAAAAVIRPRQPKSKIIEAEVVSKNLPAGRSAVSDASAVRPAAGERAPAPMTEKLQMEIKELGEGLCETVKYTLGELTDVETLHAAALAAREWANKVEVLKRKIQA